MSRKNKTILKMMRKLYYGNIRALSPHLDFMGYEIDERNYPTYHHIMKASDLKKNDLDYSATIDNGAYLGDLSHNFLHEVIEKNDLELYDDWTSLFYKIIETKSVFNDEINSERKVLQKRSEELAEYVYKNTKKLTYKRKK